MNETDLSTGKHVLRASMDSHKRDKVLPLAQRCIRKPVAQLIEDSERHIGVNVFEPIDPDIVKPLIETDDDRISYMIIVCVRDGIVDSVQKAMSPAALAVVSQVE